MPDATPTAISSIVLAAGRSTRMGAQKLLLPLADQPMVAHVVAAACASAAAPVIVVLGGEAERVRTALPPMRQVYVINMRYRDGLATSLQAGLAAVPAESPGALILLGDQPLVTATLINQVLERAAAAPDRILAARYQGRRGNPVYFPSALFGDLRAVTGDEGGRSVVERYATRVDFMDIENEVVGEDLDEPATYERFRANWARYMTPSSNDDD